MRESQEAKLGRRESKEESLGSEVGGEGLIGLASAFHYAGARTVVASLWSISDRSTAELMRSFYGFLVAGRPKDEALRLAQVEMLRHPEWRHPFYWAAFQAAGDWR